MELLSRLQNNYVKSKALEEQSRQNQSEITDLKECEQTIATSKNTTKILKTTTLDFDKKSEYKVMKSEFDKDLPSHLVWAPFKHFKGGKLLTCARICRDQSIGLTVPCIAIDAYPLKEDDVLVEYLALVN